MVDATIRVAAFDYLLSKICGGSIVGLDVPSWARMGSCESEMAVLAGTRYGIGRLALERNSRGEGLGVREKIDLPSYRSVAVRNDAHREAIQEHTGIGGQGCLRTTEQCDGER